MARETTVVRRRIAPPAGGRRRQATANGRPGARREVTLEDKYVLEEGRVLLTGVQALVRLVLDQHRADRRRGLTHRHVRSPATRARRSAASTSELAAQPRAARASIDVRHVPGLNEELGATAAWGTQLAAQLPGAALRRRGRHLVRQGARPRPRRRRPAPRQLRRASRAPAARSPWSATTRPPSRRRSRAPPSRCSRACTCRPSSRATRPGGPRPRPARRRAARARRACGPASRSSRASPTRSGTVDVAPGRVSPASRAERPASRARAERQPAAAGVARAGAHAARRRAPSSRSRTRARTASTGSTARPRRLARRSSRRARRYHDLLPGAARTWASTTRLARAGVRLLKLGMIWPLEPGIVREFAAGSTRSSSSRRSGRSSRRSSRRRSTARADAPRIVGKRDERGEPLLPAERDLDADVVARAVGRAPAGARRPARLRRGAGCAGSTPSPAARRSCRWPARTPYFCSGCPHNASTAGARGHARRRRHRLPHDGRCSTPRAAATITGITQMGGEGAQWIGMAPFTDDRHLVQNLGDGTFHHSGSLAIRAAVAAGVNITYKLLYNDAVAMTGGQAIEGQLAVPDADPLARSRGRPADHRHDRGPEPLQGRRARRRSPRCATATQLLEAQQELADVEGVTVLIHDQRVRRREAARCASAASSAEPAAARLDQRARLRGLRRLRRRSRAACRSSRSRPSSAARRRSTRRPATRTTPASRATARRSSRSCPASARRREAPRAAGRRSCPSRAARRDRRRSRCG